MIFNLLQPSSQSTAQQQTQGSIQKSCPQPSFNQGKYQSGSLKFQCEICGNSFDTEGSLKQHVRRNHQKLNKFD
jgi:hypothetical protein